MDPILSDRTERTSRHQFSSVQDGIYALGKAHMHSTPSLRRFPNVAFETVPVYICLTMALSRPFKGRSSSASSFHASLLQAIDGVMSLALYPQVVPQASQHFRSSEKQAICEGFFARQSVCSAISLHSKMRRSDGNVARTTSF